jgi:hypothetical protein
MDKVKSEKNTCSIAIVSMIGVVTGIFVQIIATAFPILVYASIGLLFCSLLTGIYAMVVIHKRRNELTGYTYALIAIFAGILMLYFTIVPHVS